MALLSARLAPAPAASRFQSARGGWPVGGGRFGGVRGIFLPAGELALQIRDLLLLIGDLPVSIRDLLVRLGYSFPKPLVLFSEAFVLPPEVFRSAEALLGSRPRLSWWPSAQLQDCLPRTHPPYGTRSHAKCPADNHTFFDNGYANAVQKLFNLK